MSVNIIFSSASVVSYWTTGGTEQQKIKAATPETGSRFGGFNHSIAIHGNTCVVGAYLEDVGGTAAGAAHIFTRSGTTWTSQQVIDNPNPTASAQFGYSVAIHNNTVVIGARYDDESVTDNGAAYVYTRSGTVWSLEQQLVSPDPKARTGGERFGSSVAIENDTCVVGTPDQWNGSTISYGAAYVFFRTGTTWADQGTLQQSGTPYLNSRQGASVAISGETIVVGADLYNSSRGAAIVYTRSGSTWSLEQVIGYTLQHRFGWAVDIDGDDLIVGAPVADSGGGTDHGYVFIYTRTGTTWSLQQGDIRPTDYEAGDKFGESVAIGPDYFAAGGQYRDDPTNNEGSAYVFTRSGSTWTQEQKLVPSTSSASDNFGISVAVDAGTVLVSAFGDDAGASASGAVFAFVSS